MFIKKLLPILLILNLLDYIITIINRGNFVEANPLMAIILDKIWLMTIFKLVIVPLCVFVLYKYRYSIISKLGTIALSGVYLYAVVLGVLYLIVNIKMGVL